MEITWICHNPECLFENVDDWDMTAFPTCSECETVVWWEDILTKDELENYLKWGAS